MPKKVSRKDRQESGTIVGRPRRRSISKRENDSVEASSASHKKIKLSTSQHVEQDLEKHYRIIDFLLVFSTLSTLVKCVECNGKIKFRTCKSEGIAFTIKVSCEKCKAPRYIPTSERVKTESKQSYYEVNHRFAFVMRLLGLGLAGCNKFCGLMDLAESFLSRSCYNTHIQKIHTTVNDVTKRFLAAAVKEEKEKTYEANNVEDSNELTISGDGTWKKRGFTSLFGVSSLIGYYTGKVIDIFVKSSYCHQCKTWENKLGTAEFEEWHEEHVNSGDCKANHDGPSGNMEVNAIIQMFKRSAEYYGVMFKNYIGDGDSKTYSGVVNSKPYGEDFTINKKECIGHVQKRMGTRLRELVKTTVVDSETKKGKKIKRKSLSGNGKLTAKMIDKLTVYYGLAIQRNHDCVTKMKNAIWATYYHYCSTDEKPQHDKCPRGEDSWCEWQKSAAANTLDSFKHSYNALPIDVTTAIKPIYEDLSKDALLQRCLGGFTQNNTESLNQLIWRISPKSVSDTAIVVEIAANVAASVFNEGSFALLAFLDEMGISTGPSAHQWARLTDELRITRANEEAALTH
ncbi:uncharacterized protein LOC130675860 [Microplitis mediator]|uniref:uncharacterized protein LOC130675860 n=1 Tax=Microplitis mediator TaxID=375433 RepID=UPI002556FEF1|nr:uncharacterized protein LOC130675860 [Microplitis mediator]